MKTIINITASISILVLLIIGCKKEAVLSDCKLLSGNLKVRRILEFDTINLTVPLKILEQYEYDEFGRISRVSVPKAIDTTIDNRLYSFNLYEYNSASQISKIVTYNANIYSPTGFINLRNQIYLYSGNGKLIKETIEYPQTGSFAYSKYLYSMSKLTKFEKYKMDTDELESYTEYKYDKCGRLIKENQVFLSDNTFIYFTEHNYLNGLNFRSDVYAGRSASAIGHIREMLKTYDTGNNLISNKINELEEYSTQPSRIIRYEYYDK
jgi:hypothetical protein